MLKYKKTLIYAAILMTLFTTIIYMINIIKVNKETKILTDDLFENVQSELVNVNKYLVYGTHLNIYGKLNLDLTNSKIDEVKLVLKDIQGDELEFIVNYKVDTSSITFNTADKINEGINLEGIPKGKYYILLKTISSSKVSYYLLDNTTKYNNIEYYTITKDHHNNKIDIYSGDYLLDGLIVPYMCMKIEPHKSLHNIYDIVIDPGHGGNDAGAVNGKYKESDVTLEYSILLKTQLEKLGLKVKLIRTDDSYVEAYGEEGRAVVPNKVKAKYVFSIHLNSTPYVMKKGGVEIYAPSNSNLYFAKMIADNIVKTANTAYSPNEINKVEAGVYVRNFTSQEIAEVNDYARNLKFSKYNITIQTPYMFMIRETGGIATNAYIDGRNKDYGVNKYYNSNIGVEGYLLELGFMTNKNDLYNLINNKGNYVKAITKSIEQYLKETN